MKHDPFEATITKLGGAELVAGFLGLTPKALELWSRRGKIPPRHHLPLLVWARDRGVDLKEAELLSATSLK